MESKEERKRNSPCGEELSIELSSIMFNLRLCLNVCKQFWKEKIIVHIVRDVAMLIAILRVDEILGWTSD